MLLWLTPHGVPKKWKYRCLVHENPHRCESPAALGELLGKHGLDAIHWSHVGELTAPDNEVLDWARERDYVVFTHDLDFGVLLSETREAGPSIIQVRTQDVTPEAIGSLVVSAVRAHEAALKDGAMMTIQLHTSRVRVLPIRRRD